MKLYACVCAAEFPAQALLRLRTELQSEPVAVLEGRAPLETVCSLNRAAHLKGASLGNDAAGKPKALPACGCWRVPWRSRPRRVPCYWNVCRSSRRALKRCAWRRPAHLFSTSQVQDCSLVHRKHWLRCLRAALTTAGFRASIAVSANFHVRSIEGSNITRCYCHPRRAGNNCACKAHPSSVESRRELRGDICDLGILTLGELAALPEVDLIARLGQQAKALARSCAWSSDPQHFNPSKQSSR